MKTRENPLVFRAKRFIGFLRILMRVKKGILGLLIIIGFGVVAFIAPVLTPYSPLGEDIETRQPVAQQFCVPVWFKILPFQLIGNRKFSENFKAVDDPGFPKLTNDTANGEWLFITEGSGVSAHLEPNVDYPNPVPIKDYLRKNGSIAITFTREEGILYTESKAYLFKKFDYPFDGPPVAFQGNVELLPNGTTYSIGTAKYLDVPIKVRVFLGLDGSKNWTLWPPLASRESMEIGSLNALIPGFTVNYTTGEVMIRQPMNGRTENGYWIISRASRETANSYIDEEELARLAMGLRIDQSPIPLIFTKTPGKYVYGIELTFIDTYHPEKTVESTVYIDDLYVATYGNSFGLMGTDHQGADLFAQLVYGTRISLYLGIAVAIMTVVLGLSVGLAAGYFGRFVDEFLMRFNDFMLCLPTLPLLIVFAAVLGTTLENLMIIMILLGWNGFARVIRSQTLSLKERPFVEAAKAAGAGSSHIVVRHILPNVMALVYVSLATSVPGAVTAEAALSWLGFFDPGRMSWGRMLYNISHLGGTAQVAVNPVWVLVPGLSISLLAVAFILVGYALDDVLNPKLRMRK